MDRLQARFALEIEHYVRVRNIDLILDNDLVGDSQNPGSCKRVNHPLAKPILIQRLASRISYLAGDRTVSEGCVVGCVLRWEAHPEEWYVVIVKVNPVSGADIRSRHSEIHAPN